ncbi:MAG: MFS transporter [Acidimicrobiales bacterium]
MRLLTDLGPLRQSRPFRRLWVGSTFSSVGSALTTFAVPLQIFDITHSSLAVGGLGIAQLVPLLSVGLIGGRVADTLDRRRVLLATTTVSTVVSAVLTAQAFAGLRLVWVLYGVVAIKSAAGALGAPARRALVPRLLAADQLPAGLALNRITFQLMLAAGPALGGLIASVPALGLRGCYLVDTASSVASFWGVAGLPLAAGAPRPDAGGLADGLRLIRRSQALSGALLLDMTATAFALPIVLFPAINAARFGGNPQTLGLFTAAIGAGGLLTAVMSAPFTRVERRGVLMLVAVATWGAAFAGFAVVSALWPTLCLLGVAGAADTITVVSRSAIIQSNAPDHARGRVSAAEYIASGAGSYLGDLGSGALASVTTAATSALIGGLATVAGTAVIGLTLPGLRCHRSSDSPLPDQQSDTRMPATPSPTP